MKLIAVFVVCFFYQLTEAQNAHYLKVVAGPKIDFTSVKNNAVVRKINQVDYSYGFYAGKRLSKMVSLEMGVVRHNYTNTLEVSTVSNSGENIKLFGDYKFETLKSYQICLLGSFRRSPSEKWDVYVNAGFHMFLNKKSLSYQSYISVANHLKKNGKVIESYVLKVFNTKQEPGSIIYRCDFGGCYNVGEHLSFDINLSGRASPKPIYTFDFELKHDNVMIDRKGLLESNAVSLGVNFGLKYRFGSII